MMFTRMLSCRLQFLHKISSILRYYSHMQKSIEIEAKLTKKNFKSCVNIDNNVRLRP